MLLLYIPFPLGALLQLLPSMVISFYEYPEYYVFLLNFLAVQLILFQAALQLLFWMLDLSLI